MFNATSFHYDGKWSADFGLRIANVNGNNIVEDDAISVQPSLSKASGSVRFFHGGITYDSPPTCEFSVISEMELVAEIRSSILSWLIGKNGFKQLKFDNGDNSSFTYYCVFTSAKTIYINGRCRGFRLTAQFDSPYARGASTSVTTSAGTHTVTICNKSNVIDGYVYPIVTFSGSSVDIVNNTDDSGRHFLFNGLESSESVTVDNESRIITSTHAGEKLSNFKSKNWLRLRPGNNSLTITSAGSVTITCPYYAMIGY